MATLTNLAVQPSPSNHIRPFDIRRDLGAVAELVEKCFADTLDPDGERYLRQMRSAARNPGLLRWAAAASEFTSLPLTGFIWEQGQHIIGNVSLIPYNIRGQRNYLIANVAVHPDYRRQGIARMLTARAVDFARQRGAPSTWLHVRENNEPAVRLYRSLGFVERARRTTWYSKPDLSQSASVIGVRVGSRASYHWDAQRFWLRRIYPPEVTWHLPLNLNALRPGLIGAAYRILTNTYTRHWSAYQGNRLIGVLSWQATSNYANSLWLAVAPENEETAVHTLLAHARRRLAPRRPLSLDYPARLAESAIQAAGFYPQQSLIWMTLPLKSA